MSISIFSCLTAFLWFDLALLVCAILGRQSGLPFRFGCWPAALLLAAALVRLLCPVTFSSTRVVHSTVILPLIQSALCWKLPLFRATLGEGLFVVWFAGIAVSLFKLAVDLRRDWQAVKRCALLGDSRIEAIAHSVVGKRVAVSCRFLLAPGASSPLMVGFFRPVFILPAYLTGFTDEEVRFVICHEWQHFRYRNNCWKLAAEILICLLWWNPPVYLLRRELAQLMELSCDRQVVRRLSQKEKAAYLETIVKSLRFQQNSMAFSGRLELHLPGSGKASELKRRFQMVAQNGREHPGGILLCAVCLVLLLAASLLVVIQPFQVPEREALDKLGIVAYDTASGSAHMEEDEDGRFVAYFFGTPCYTYDWVLYDLSDLKGKDQYICLGKNTNSQNFVSINGLGGGLMPILCRTDSGELVPVYFPASMASSVRKPAIDKNECIRYFCYSDGGVLQQRLWSATYNCWISEWEDAAGDF